MTPPIMGNIKLVKNKKKNLFFIFELKKYFVENIIAHGALLVAPHGQQKVHHLVQSRKYIKSYEKISFFKIIL